MFVVYGVKTFRKILGMCSYNAICPVCNNTISYNVVRHFIWFSLFWIPLIPLSKKYFLCCPVCKSEKKITKQQAMLLINRQQNKEFEVIK